ncbi:unnamed protein product [Pleuronectes platessa]|uniref:Uncharacterized protein n=1 Tax=Pleuronectes platessa TaxID=8262 RepID=A0A9N7UQJ3_PLEPL|nr:unnamed protein product [Pleuronectes platessa]
MKEMDVMFLEETQSDVINESDSRSQSLEGNKWLQPTCWKVKSGLVPEPQRHGGSNQLLLQSGEKNEQRNPRPALRHRADGATPDHRAGTRPAARQLHGGHSFLWRVMGTFGFSAGFIDQGAVQ